METPDLFPATNRSVLHHSQHDSFAIMIKDPIIIKWLNLVRKSETLVLKEVVAEEQRAESINAGDELTIVEVESIPENSGFYWVGGYSILNCGVNVFSVFLLDTDDEGAMDTIYWWVDRHWYTHYEKEARYALGLSEEAVFPIDWKLNVPYEGYKES